VLFIVAARPGGDRGA